MKNTRIILIHSQMLFVHFVFRFPQSLCIVFLIISLIPTIKGLGIGQLPASLYHHHSITLLQTRLETTSNQNHHYEDRGTMLISQTHQVSLTMFRLTKKSTSKPPSGDFTTPAFSRTERVSRMTLVGISAQLDGYPTVLSHASISCLG